MGLVGQATAHNRVVGWDGVGGRARDSTQQGGGVGVGVGQETAHNWVVGWGGVGGRARDSTQQGGGVGWGWG